MRAPQAAVAGTAVVKLSLQGWPGVKTEPAEFEVPVLARKKVYRAEVSSRHRTAWPVGERWHVQQMLVAPNAREVSVLSCTGAEYNGETTYLFNLYRLCRWEIMEGQARQILDKILDLDAERDLFLAKARTLRFRLKNLMPTISDAKFSADGRWVIVTTQLPDEWRKTEQGQEVQNWTGRVALIDARAGAVSRQLETEGLPYSSPCFSPDGRIAAALWGSGLASRADAKTDPEKRAGPVRLWDVANGRVKTTLHLDPGERAFGRRIVFSPDGKTLAISYVATDPSTKTRREMVELWDIAKNTTLAELPNWEDVCFVAGGRYLVGQLRNDRQGQLLLYDRDTKEDRRVFTYEIPKQVLYGVSSWVHVLGAADSQSVLCCFYDGRVVKLDLPSGKVVAEQKATTKDHRFYNRWALSDDGRFLAGNVYTSPPSRGLGTMPEDLEEVPPAEITIWDTAKLIRLETLTGHEGGNNHQMTFAAGGQWLLSVGGSPLTMKLMLRLWDLRNVDRNNTLHGLAQP